jgi:membrane fusion protein, multidrug efflux system
MAQEVETPVEQKRSAAEAPPVRRRARFWVLQHPLAALALIVFLIVAIIGGIRLLEYFSSYESTDDAQVDGYIYPVSARINGRVTAVNADINQPVEAGQPLIQLDPTDYQVAVQRAQADLAQAQATAQAAQTQIPITSTSTSSQVSATRAGVQDASAGVAVAEQQYIAAQARIAEAQANYVKAQRDVDRYRPLVEKQEISKQQFDQAVATADALKATLETVKASADASARQVTQARARVAVAEAQQSATNSAPQEVAGQTARASSAQATADMNRASLEMAKLNVQYTMIAAPVAGVIGQRNVQIGQQIQPGQQLMSVVPLTDLWVTANLKETQLRHMRIGQKSDVKIDATGQTLKAHVDSFPAATGARYSLLPPENATGNYVKVVQRLPVKLVFEPNQDVHMLRPGMSLDIKVWVK